MKKLIIAVTSVILCLFAVLILKYKGVLNFSKAPSDDKTTTSSMGDYEKESVNVKFTKHTKESNGVILTLYVPGKVSSGERFFIIEKVVNNSGKDIYYSLPYYSTKTHLDVRTEIIDKNKKCFIDCDTFGQSYPEATSRRSIREGETYSQTVFFLPGYVTNYASTLEDSKVSMFDKGEYQGSANFNWFEDYSMDTGLNNLSIDFSVTVD